MGIRIWSTSVAVAAASAALAVAFPAQGSAQTTGSGWVEARVGRAPVSGWAAPAGQGSAARERVRYARSLGLAIGTPLVGGWSARLVLEHTPGLELSGAFCGPATPCAAAGAADEARALHGSIGWDVGFTPGTWLGLSPSAYAGPGIRLRHLRRAGDAGAGGEPPRDAVALALVGRFGAGLSTALGPAEIFSEIGGVIGRAGSRAEPGARPPGADGLGSEPDVGLGVVAGLRWRLR